MKSSWISLSSIAMVSVMWIIPCEPQIGQTAPHRTALDECRDCLDRPVALLVQIDFNHFLEIIEGKPMGDHLSEVGRLFRGPSAFKASH